MLQSAAAGGSAASGAKARTAATGQIALAPLERSAVGSG